MGRRLADSSSHFLVVGFALLVLCTTTLSTSIIDHSETLAYNLLYREPNSHLQLLGDVSALSQSLERQRPFAVSHDTLRLTAQTPACPTARPRAPRALALALALAAPLQISDTPGALTRTFLSNGHRKAAAVVSAGLQSAAAAGQLGSRMLRPCRSLPIAAPQLQRWMNEAGMTSWVDSIGNVHGHVEGRNDDSPAWVRRRPGALPSLPHCSSPAHDPVTTPG